MNASYKKLVFHCAIAVLFIALTNISAKAQFWTEDFVPVNSAGEADGYVSNNGTWNVTPLAGNLGQFSNIWYVSCEEASMVPNNCGGHCTGIPQPPPTPVIGQSLHIGSGIFGDMGALYVETGLNETDTELRVESPSINCIMEADINLSFNYIEFGDGANDNAQVWYFNGAVWAFLADMPKTTCGDGQSGPCNAIPCDGTVVGLWSTFTIHLPASANNNPNVKIGFTWQNIDDGIATDPSIAVGNIQLASSGANFIFTGMVNTNTLCLGASFNIDFISTGVFNAGNVYTAELSDASGSFASPIAIGTFTSTTNSGGVTATIPSNTVPGANYRVRIVSSNAVVVGTDNGVDLIISSNAIPNVMLDLSPIDFQCENVTNLNLVGGLPLGGIYIGNTVNAGIFNPNAAGLGEHLIQYQFTDSNNCSAVANDTILVSGCTPLNEINSFQKSSVFPNPGNGELTILLRENMLDKTTKYVVYDAKGIIVKQGKLVAIKTTINLNECAKGLYIIRIQNDANDNTHRYLKN